jgi:prepilin peptidase CpaA
MQIDPLRLVLVTVFVALLVAAATYDYKSRRIPNWTVLGLLGLFLPTALLNLQPVSLASSLTGFAVALAATMILWMARIVGGGDSKLFSAVSLFFGLKYLWILASATAIAGGLVALVMLLRRPTRALVMLQMRGKGDWGGGVPYGIAIAAGGLAAAGLTGFVWPRHVVSALDLNYLSTLRP